MKRRAVAVAVVGILLAALCAGPSSALAERGGHAPRAGSSGSQLRELIPLYDGANPFDWARACSQSNGSQGGSWLIANVANGPGDGPVPAWANVIDHCYDAGRASVIGYVWTNYGSGGDASIPAIEAQINAWYSSYPGEIAGIFFDGVSDKAPGSTAGNERFYRTLAAYVHAEGAANNEVVFNFGRNPESDWMLSGSNSTNADIVVTFEGSYDNPGLNPYTSWTPPSWESSYPANDFAAFIYDAPGTDLAPQPAGACESLSRQNIGYADVGMDYGSLPTYFEQFANGC
jgi:spherulation-specific family 4 protein